MVKSKTSVYLTLAGIIGVIGLGILSFLIHQANAIVNYPPVASITKNDITSEMIEDGTIVDADIATSAKISIFKLYDESATGTIAFFDGDGFATSSKFKWDETTSSLDIQGQIAVSGTTTFNGVSYNWPSTAGSSGQVLMTDGSKTLSWTDKGANNILFKGTSGESINAGDLVFFANSTTASVYNQDIYTSESSQNKLCSSSGPIYKRAMKISLSQGTIVSKVKVAIDIPTQEAGDNAILQIQTNSGGNPSGTVIASSSVPFTQIPTNQTWVDFELNQEVELSAGTTYWAVLACDPAIPNSGYMFWAGNQSCSGTSGYERLWNGSSWQAQNCDLSLKLRRDMTAGRLYRTDGRYSATSNNWLGFAADNATEGNSLNVIVEGIVSQLTGIATDTVYYISDTLGAITATQQTSTKTVGRGIGPDSILIIR